jgi:DNA helicase-4
MPQPETFEYAEERRLFYVARTRASRGVFLLMNGTGDLERLDDRWSRIESQSFRGLTFALEALKGSERTTHCYSTSAKLASDQIA